MDRKKLDISIISDVHLGTYECYDKELLQYLRSIKPEVLILNGDFIDVAKLERGNFPRRHLLIIQEVLDLASHGTKVYYITRDKEKLLRNFPKFSLDTIHVRQKLELQLKEGKYLIFHGATFDPVFKIPSFIIKPGSKIYDLLLRGNRMFSGWKTNRTKDQKEQIRNNGIKKSIRAIKIFEEAAVRLARQESCDYVICGHIHQPMIKSFLQNEKTVVYMNTGDWVENLTALEYRFGKWKLYFYDKLDYKLINPKLSVKSKKVSLKESKSASKERFGSIVETNNLRSNRMMREI